MQMLQGIPMSWFFSIQAALLLVIMPSQLLCLADALEYLKHDAFDYGGYNGMLACSFAQCM